MAVSASLINRLLRDFQMDADQTDALASSIYQTESDAALATYEDGYSALGLELPADWGLPESVLRSLASDSIKLARGIARTLRSDLKAELRALVASGRFDALTPRAAYDALHEALRTWLTEHMQWKVDQIAATEVSRGANAGMEALLNDLEGGPLDLPDGMTYEDLEITVIPDDSSGDAICGDFAGNVYSASDAGLLPSFPAHPGCPHQKVIVVSATGAQVGEIDE